MSLTFATHSHVCGANARIMTINPPTTEVEREYVYDYHPHIQINSGGGGGGVTPIDSVVTIATVGQSFDHSGLTVDHADFRPLTYDHQLYMYEGLSADRSESL